MGIRDYEDVGKEFMITLGVLTDERVYNDTFQIFFRGMNMTNFGLMKDFSKKIRNERILAHKNELYYTNNNNALKLSNASQVEGDLENSNNSNLNAYIHSNNSNLIVSSHN